MLSLGFDDNLGFPAQLADELHCQLSAYHNLDALISDFVGTKLDAIFVPAATLLSVNCDYKILAQATLDYDQKTHLTTFLVSAKYHEITTITQHLLGRVNAYCTTSYWSPMLFVQKPLIFKDSSTFKGLLEQVVSGEVDYAMIWDKILEQYADLRAQLYILGKYEDLPTQLILGQPNFPKELTQHLQHFFNPAAPGFFSGFTKPNLAQLNNFLQRLSTLQTQLP